MLLRHAIILPKLQSHCIYYLLACIIILVMMMMMW